MELTCGHIETTTSVEEQPKIFEALQIAIDVANSSDESVAQRGWQLFMLLPRMLLHRPARGGLISKEKFEHFDLFARGEWLQLLEMSEQCDEDAARARRRRRSQGDDLERRVSRAQALVHLGELSSARQALEQWRRVPMRLSLSAFSDPSRDLPCSGIRCLRKWRIMSHAFHLIWMRTDSGRISGPPKEEQRQGHQGPSGMTTEHFRTLLRIFVLCIHSF